MEIPYTVTARPDTGLYNAKVGIWLFLASEVMLFGGLFSSYVFLRIGAHDYPWPFHELVVFPGFLNTMILIASSVTVVAAWAALKARRYGWFQINMIITLLCALGFMGIKSVEYWGKFHHYSVVLTDGTVIDGHPVHSSEQTAGDEIAFGEIKTVSMNLEKATLSFLDHLRVNEGGEKSFSKAVAGKPLQVTMANGQPAEVNKKWLKQQKEEYFTRKGEVAEKMTALERRKVKGEDITAEKAELEKLWPVQTLQMQVAAGAPLQMLVGDRDIAGYTPAGVTFRDDTTVSGRLMRDFIPFNADKIDLRMVKNPEKSLAWKYYPQLKEDYLQVKEKKTAEFKEHHKKHASSYQENADWMRSALQLNIMSDLPKEKSEELEKVEHAVNIERADKRFYSNFSPSRSPYYAIYFLMTGLHGLHVVGGAIVLSYFLFTGRKMYKNNPEHLANRVEVGGLFWHFVDLVWIFLFPVFYLM